MMITTLKQSGVYCIINLVNNKVYVGGSVNIQDRIKYHKGVLKRNTHHSVKLQSDWNKYGENNFDFVVIEIIDILKNGKLLSERELYWINHFNSIDSGYNMNAHTGGSGNAGQPQRGDLPVSSLHLSVAGEVKQSIDDIASKSGWSKSYLVEQILRNYLKLPADYDWSDLELVKSGKFE